MACGEAILCVVFFFFKQETAYEMRISDWSSDVCSSDLDVPAAGREIGARDEEGGRAFAALHRGVEGAGREGQGQGRDGYREGRRPRHRQEYRRRRAPVQREIGRASCRESVCQYV